MRSRSLGRWVEEHGGAYLRTSGGGGVRRARRGVAALAFSNSWRCNGKQSMHRPETTNENRHARRKSRRTARLRLTPLACQVRDARARTPLRKPPASPAMHAAPTRGLIRRKLRCSAMHARASTAHPAWLFVLTDCFHPLSAGRCCRRDRSRRPSRDHHVGSDARARWYAARPKPHPEL